MVTSRCVSVTLASPDANASSFPWFRSPWWPTGSRCNGDSFAEKTRHRSEKRFCEQLMVSHAQVVADGSKPSTFSVRFRGPSSNFDCVSGSSSLPRWSLRDVAVHHIVNKPWAIAIASDDLRHAINGQKRSRCDQAYA